MFIVVKTSPRISHQLQLLEETSLQGRKPGDVLRVRGRSSEPLGAVAGRSTLGEVLSDIPPDFSQLHYQSKHQGGLKMVFTRVSA